MEFCTSAAASGIDPADQPSASTVQQFKSPAGRRQDRPDLASRNTGAARVFRTLVPVVDSKSHRITAFVLRHWGFLVFGFVAAIEFADAGLHAGSASVWRWLLAYGAYLLILEAMHAYPRSAYEGRTFRVARIAANLVFFSLLYALLPNGRSSVWCLLAQPVLASAMYLRRPLGPIITLLAAVLGLFLGGVVFASQPALTPVEFGATSVSLCVLSLVLWRSFDALNSKLHDLTTLCEKLYGQLELDPLLQDLVHVAAQVSGGQRVIAIVIDPERQTYLAHGALNLRLREGRSMDFVTANCAVLKTGKPFRSPEISAELRALYGEAFSCEPRSVMSVPLRDHRGMLLGVLSITHDAADRFDGRAAEQLQVIADAGGGAIANALHHRRLQLREAATRVVSERLTTAQDEEEVTDVLIEEAVAITGADGAVLFERESPNGPFRPVASPSTSLSMVAKRYLSSTLEEHIAELAEAKLIGDAAQDPWFGSSALPASLASILLVRLPTRDGDARQPVLCCYAGSVGLLSADAELAVVSLVHQAALALEFVHWRKHGGYLKLIYDAVADLDDSTGEEALCATLVAAAYRILRLEKLSLGLLDHNEHVKVVAQRGYEPGDLALRYDAAVLNVVRAPRFTAECSYLIPCEDGEWPALRSRLFARSAPSSDGSPPTAILLTPLTADPDGEIGWLQSEIRLGASTALRQTIEAVGAFASAAGGAIARARASAKLRLQRAQQDEFIRSIGDELARCNDLDALGEVVVQVGAKLLSSKACSLMLVRGEELELTHSSYLAGTSLIGRRIPIRAAEGAGLPAWVAATGRAIRANHGMHERHAAWRRYDHHEKYLREEVDSLLIVPIRDADRVLGVITAENKLGDRAIGDGFDEEDERRFAFLASRIAVALGTLDYCDSIKRAEREALGDDLHELVQWLQGVHLELSATAKWLERGEVERASAVAPELCQTLHSVLSEVKSIFTAVSSAQPQSEDFGEVLRHLAAALIRRLAPRISRARIDVDCADGTLALPPSVQAKYLRIASAGLGNALIHSGVLQGRDVRIVARFRHQNGSSVLEIEDTGQGCSKIEPGYGLTRAKQLEEQLTALGFPSTLTTESFPGHGTRLRIETHIRAVEK